MLLSTRYQGKRWRWAVSLALKSIKDRITRQFEQTRRMRISDQLWMQRCKNLKIEPSGRFTNSLPLECTAICRHGAQLNFDIDLVSRLARTNGIVEGFTLEGAQN